MIPQVDVSLRVSDDMTAQTSPRLPSLALVAHAHDILLRTEAQERSLSRPMASGLGWGESLKWV